MISRLRDKCYSRGQPVTDKAGHQLPASENPHGPKSPSHSEGNGNTAITNSTGNVMGNASVPTTGTSNPQNLSVPQAVTCPYHGPILQMNAPPEIQGYGLNSMERFMAHSPGEQYALFNRPDNGGISTSKNCACGVIMGFNFDMEHGVHVEKDELCGYQVGL